MSRSRSSSSSRNSKGSNRRSQSKQRERRRSQSNRRSEKGGQNTCLYIGNLDKRCSEQNLKNICKEYGPFEYCYIVFEPSSQHDRNKQTKISRGYGFVKYEKEADAAKAKQALNGKQIMTRKVNVQVSKRNRPRESTPGRYLGRRRSPPRRERQYRRRSYSHSSDDYRRKRKYSDDRDRDRQRKHRDRDHKQRRRDRSRSGEKKHKKRRQSRSNSPRK